MKIVIVRHGQTFANIITEEEKLMFCCGALESDITDLTNLGIEQAKALESNEYIKQIEKVYSSDLRRAIRTATYAKPGCEINIDKRLRERSLGIFEGKYESYLKENPELRKYLDDDRYNKFKSDFYQKAPEGESYSDVSKRVLDFLNSLDLTEDITIGLFTHNHVIRCLFLNLLGIEPKESVIKLKIGNCVPYVFDGTEIGKFKLISDNDR